MHTLEKKRIVRFLVGSLVSTAFMYFLYLILDRYMSYQWAYFFAYIISVLFAYLYSALYVFNSSISWKSFLTYPFVYVVQYVLSALGLEYLVRNSIADEQIAPAIMMMVVAPITYILSKLVFKFMKSG